MLYGNSDGTECMIVANNLYMILGKLTKRKIYRLTVIIYNIKEIYNNLITCGC